MENDIYFMVDDSCHGVVDETSSTVIYSVCRLFFRDMVDNTSIYGSAVIYAVHFSVT